MQQRCNFHFCGNRNDPLFVLIRNHLIRSKSLTWERPSFFPLLSSLLYSLLFSPSPSHSHNDIIQRVKGMIQPAEIYHRLLLHSLLPPSATPLHRRMTAAELLQSRAIFRDGNIEDDRRCRQKRFIASHYAGSCAICHRD